MKRKYVIMIGLPSFLILAMAFGVLAPEKNIDSKEDYISYVNNPSNGLMKLKEVNGFNLTAKLLPRVIDIDTLGFKLDFGLDSSVLRFLFIVAPDGKSRRGDVMYQSISNMEEYATRVHNLAFGMNENFWVKYKGTELKNVVVHFEQTYSLTESRTFIITCDIGSLARIEELDAPIELWFSDDEFNSGLNQFYFDYERIQELIDLTEQ